jgi:murein L,D-transpeptidase YafK
VSKAARRLDAACEGGGRLSWTVALGRDPHGPKQRAGDHRTPEGLYHVSGPARRSRFHRFLPIDYPSLADAEQARSERRLARADFERIAAAHARGAPPPMDTPLGGDLGFHGEGERWRGDSEDLDWTYGCLGMSDEAIEFLAARAPRGTPVRILP